jgi:transaldolase
MDPSSLKVKIFVDTADLTLLRKYADHPLVRGVTTNPSLARKAGISSYPDFIREVLAIYPDRPVSLEVVGDDHETMRRQAHALAAFAPNVYVKIPAFNSQGVSSYSLIRELHVEGVRVNCTAVMDMRTISSVCSLLTAQTPSILSVFAGRISDSGRRASSYVEAAVESARGKPIEVLWASTREIYNVVEADQAGAQIITLFPSFLDKLPQFGRDLREFEIETSRQFLQDSISAGYTL